MSAAIGDIRRVNVFYRAVSGSYENSFGFECVTNVPGDDMSDLANAFKTALIKNTSGGLLYGAVTAIQSDHLDVEDVVPGTAATFELSYTAVAGTNAAELGPPQGAALFSLRTALKGRSYRGRFYLPGYGENATNAGVLESSTLTNYQTIATQLLAVFGPAGTNGDWRLGVISTVHDHLPLVPPIITPVTAITVDTILRTQRRRVIGVGS